jgi:hypothetical protein
MASRWWHTRLIIGRTRSMATGPVRSRQGVLSSVDVGDRPRADTCGTLFTSIALMGGAMLFTSLTK